MKLDEIDKAEIKGTIKQMLKADKYSVKTNLSDYAELAAEGGRIIATGGGAVLDGDNVRALRRNGVIVFLDRAVHNLVATDDRPLSSERNKLEKLYAERYDVYRMAAELIIDANRTPEEEAREILKELGE